VQLVPLAETALDVARAMAHLHQHNIVHSDLKARNVLLRSDMQDPRGFTAKVADFGLSLTIDPNSTHISNAFQVRFEAGWPAEAEQWRLVVVLKLCLKRVSGPGQQQLRYQPPAEGMLCSWYLQHCTIGFSALCPWFLCWLLPAECFLCLCPWFLPPCLCVHTPATGYDDAHGECAWGCWQGCRAYMHSGCSHKAQAHLVSRQTQLQAFQFSSLAQPLHCVSLPPPSLPLLLLPSGP
jgi:hypothetical protein